MRISFYRVIATVAAVMVSSAAMCNKDGGASASSSSASAVAAKPLGGEGVPTDFPAAPGLTPCAPIKTMGNLVGCKWPNVDGHAIYSFYNDALPKAGYQVTGSDESTSPKYDGTIGFMKGNVKGAISIVGSELEIEFSGS